MLNVERVRLLISALRSGQHEQKRGGLNVERVRLLAAALRSGEYEQGRGSLNENGRFCCLGVATEVAMANGCPVERVSPDPQGIVAYRNVTAGWTYATKNVLHCSVVAWYGFESIDPILINDDTPATEANDGLRLSFAAIADAFDALADAAEREQEGK